MLKVLTVGQHKGGVGKTTVSRLIACAAARAGHRVLVVDLDSQCSLSQRFLKMRTEPGSSYDTKIPPVHPDFEEIRLEDPNWDGISCSADPYLGEAVYPYATGVPNLDILPAHGRKTARVNRVDDAELYDRVYKRMGEFIALPEVQEAWDLVIFDTPPALDSSLPESAMMASTHLLIPALMEPQCVEGLPAMLSMWMKANAKRGTDRIELIGIAVNMYQSSLTLHRATLEQISADANIGPFVLPEKLGRRGAFSESDHESLRPTSVLANRRSDPARREAEALCERVLTAMGLAYQPAQPIEVAA